MQNIRLLQNSLFKHPSQTKYHHAKWENRRKVLRFLLRTVGMNLLIKLDSVEGLENIPAQGPAILFINHIAFVDPIIIVHIMPRQIVPLAKIEVYDYPGIGILPHLWGVVPVRREEFDRRAISQILEVLKAGEMVLIAPEGTRRPTLARAKEGIAFLAARTQVPLIPIAVDGTEGFPAFRLSARWRKPGAHIRIGKPFRFRPDIVHPDRNQLRLMTDEAMFILASLLPQKLRGEYGDLSQASQTTIQWLNSS